MAYSRIRDLREDNDLTQAQIAKIIHMHKTTYVRYESGEREIPLNIAILLAEYYNVSLDYLAGRTNKK
ncbi:MAG: helix-turn-helix transcriptional regulator [Ruminococcaceae bacterium]|nr:helix-turn-helix transcriptional regulator [Oscillospiraceae bacterium]